MNSMKSSNKMDTKNIYLGIPKKNETSDSHILLTNLSEKINFKRSDTYAALSNLSIYMEKYEKDIRKQ